MVSISGSPLSDGQTFSCDYIFSIYRLKEEIVWKSLWEKFLISRQKEKTIHGSHDHRSFDSHWERDDICCNYISLPCCELSFYNDATNCEYDTECVSTTCNFSPTMAKGKLNGKTEFLFSSEQSRAKQEDKHVEKHSSIKFN